MDRIEREGEGAYVLWLWFKASDSRNVDHIFNTSGACASSTRGARGARGARRTRRMRDRARLLGGGELRVPGVRSKCRATARQHLPARPPAASGSLSNQLSGRFVSTLRVSRATATPASAIGLVPPRGGGPHRLLRRTTRSSRFGPWIGAPADRPGGSRPHLVRRKASARRARERELGIPPARGTETDGSARASGPASASSLRRTRPLQVIKGPHAAAAAFEARHPLGTRKRLALLQMSSSNPRWMPATEALLVIKTGSTPPIVLKTPGPFS